MLESPVDYETKSTYNLRIKSSFSDGLVLEESFELLVEDIHEPPHSVVLSKSSIDEGLKSGSVVAQLTAVDPDRDDQVQFTLPRSFLSSTDNDQFSIVDNNLVINSIPDFESNSEYNLVVRATDSFGLFSDHNISLTVNDVNDPPSEVFATVFQFDENLPTGATIAQLSSDDPDQSDSISFSLIPDSALII